MNEPNDHTLKHKLCSVQACFKHRRVLSVQALFGELSNLENRPPELPAADASPNLSAHEQQANRATFSKHRGSILTNIVAQAIVVPLAHDASFGEFLT